MTATLATIAGLVVFGTLCTVVGWSMGHDYTRAMLQPRLDEALDANGELAANLYALRRKHAAVTGTPLRETCQLSQSERAAFTRLVGE